MKRNGVLYLSVGAFAVFIFILITNFTWSDFFLNDVGQKSDGASLALVSSQNSSSDFIPIDYETYNIDYMNDEVKNILVKRMGSKRVDFYLPPTGYVNVSRGSKYGVAFVIQNVDPKIPEGNEFSFEVKVDSSSVGNCDVSESVAQGWIERGWTSSGVIGGQWREDWNDWYDAMTVYFSFPLDVEPCNIKYDFVLMRDGVDYDSWKLEFNLI